MNTASCKILSMFFHVAVETSGFLQRSSGSSYAGRLPTRWNPPVISWLLNHFSKIIPTITGGGRSQLYLRADPAPVSIKGSPCAWSVSPRPNLQTLRIGTAANVKPYAGTRGCAVTAGGTPVVSSVTSILIPRITIHPKL